MGSSCHSRQMTLMNFEYDIRKTIPFIIDINFTQWVNSATVNRTKGEINLRKYNVAYLRAYFVRKTFNYHNIMYSSIGDASPVDSTLNAPCRRT